MLAWKALMSMGGRSDMKPTVSDRMAPRPDGSMTWRIVGSSVSNSLRTSWVKICYNVITCFSCQTGKVHLQTFRVSACTPHGAGMKGSFNP